MRLLIKCIEKYVVVLGDGSDLKSAAAPLSVETSGRMIRKPSKQSLQITPKLSHVCITVPLKLRCRFIEIIYPMISVRTYVHMSLIVF